MDLSSPATTVGVALARAAVRLTESGSGSARLDAEVLLSWVAGVDRSVLLAHPEAPLGSGQIERYEAAVERRGQGEPVAYIRGTKEFYASVISVDPRVLVPRPETETLVDLALERISVDLTQSLWPVDAGPYLVWDVGAGSGAITIALANELRRRGYGDAVRFLLTDASADALAVALINVVSHGLADRIAFAEGDLLDVTPLPPGLADLIVANLPYIPSSAMEDLPASVHFEPDMALDGGMDGLDIIRRLLPRLPAAIKPHGMVLLEIGGDQEGPLREAVTAALPSWRTVMHADLSGSPRVAQLDPPG